VYSCQPLLRNSFGPSGKLHHASAGIASITCRSLDSDFWISSSAFLRASSARLRSIPCAIVSATDASVSRMDSENVRRANSATTPTSRSSTSNGYPAKATIPLFSAQPLSFTRGSFSTSLVKCAFFSRAIKPTFRSPTGIRLYDPSKRVYIPALACSSNMLSSLLSVQIRAKAASR
jgi:hypothetical protein